MELLHWMILFVLASLPWYLAFEKLNRQASGRSIFIKSLRKWFFIAFFWFGLFSLLALSNSIPEKNTTGSYSAAEIRQAIYFFIGIVLVVLTYISSGIQCYQMAKERHLFLNPPKKKPLLDNSKLT